MLPQLLQRLLMTLILVQFNHQLGAFVVDHQLAVAADVPDTFSIRHGRSRVHRHLHNENEKVLRSRSNENFTLERSTGNSVLGGEVEKDVTSNYLRGVKTNTTNNYEPAVVRTALRQLTEARPLAAKAQKRIAHPSIMPLAAATTQSGVTLAPVTHKIRKLHKKQMIESLRNRGLPGNHHRSLTQAEQLRERPTQNMVLGPDNDTTGYKDIDKPIRVDKLQVDNSYTEGATDAEQYDDVFYQDDEYRSTVATLAIPQETLYTTIATMYDYNADNTETENSLTTKNVITKLHRVLSADTKNFSYGKSAMPESQMDYVGPNRLSNIADSVPEVTNNTVLPVVDSSSTNSEGKLIPPDVSGDDVLEYEWAENSSNIPSFFASTSLGGINLEHQQSPLSTFNLQEINLGDISPSHNADEGAMDDGLIDNRHASGFPIESDDNTLMAMARDEEDALETNSLLEGVIDAANEDEIYDWDEISRNNRRNLMRGRDVVTKFLQIVETQHLLGSKCEAGTSLNLGEGVVDRYAQDRFRIEAEVAVNRANMLTR